MTLRDSDITTDTTTSSTMTMPAGDADQGDSNDRQVDPAGSDPAGSDPGGDVVVRVYEALGARATGRLAFGFPVGSVTTTDLLERPLPGGAIDLHDGGLRLALRPFQVLTLRVTRPT